VSANVVFIINNHNDAECFDEIKTVVANSCSFSLYALRFFRVDDPSTIPANRIYASLVLTKLKCNIFTLSVVEKKENMTERINPSNVISREK
jgi:hypothetical protein